MRKRLAALLAVWLGVAASSAVCGSLWIAQDDALVRLEKGERVQAGSLARVHALAPTVDGGAWVINAGGLWALSADGAVRVHIDLVGRGFGNAAEIAADAYDDSVWITTDASLLLHFARDGSLAHGTTLSAPAAALATDLDESAWVVVRDELLHFARDGTQLTTRALNLREGESVTALAVDALRGQDWIATSQGIYRLARSAEPLRPSTPWLRGVATSLVLDPRSGVALAIVDGFLVAFDGDAQHGRDFDQLLAEDEPPIALLYDAIDAAFVVETTRGLLRVASDGYALERLPSAAPSILAAVPFRIEPTLVLVRPPDGGATADAHAEIVLRVGASCNGSACELQGYLGKLRVTAALDTVPLGEPRVETPTGRTTFPQRPPMAPGYNELSARVVDAFGHSAMLDRGRWTLLPPATAAMETTPGPVPAAERGVPVAKAANKAPTVLLTSPAGGDVFSAGGAITLAATATDSDGSIAKVEFYRGGTTLIGTATAAPYRYVWVNPAAGNYSLTAKAYDDRKGTATSAPVTIVVANNQLPAITMTSPAADSFVVVESSVTVSAAAIDPDGTIAGVEFFDGATPIGIAVTEPYEVTWHAALPGVHSISARATDNKGGTSQSAPIVVTVGGPPVVVVTGPTACSSIDGPLDVPLAADAISTGGRIVSVEFFDGGSPVGTSSVAPWRSTLVNASTGSHSITAKATDEQGLTTTSRASTFTIRGANQPPSVALTSPTEGARFAFGSAVNLTATAADADGTIIAVEFRNGGAAGSLLGRTTTFPYAASWTNAAAGSYAIVAVAYDDRNATTTSAVVHVTIDANVLPTIGLTAPAANARYTAPANIAMAASASDSDGTVTRVEFYAGAALIGSSNAAPYTATWSNVASGSYSIMAKATDNVGGVAASAAVTVTVVDNTLPTIALTAPVPGGQYFAPATVSLAATAADSDGAVAKVDFYANGSLIGTSETAPYGFVWDGIGAGTYALTAKATDDAGGISTSAAVTITVSGAPAINMEGALAGATIDDDNVLVRGVVSAPANSAVTVNGVVTHIDDLGRFQANDVPLVPGSNTVTAVVTTQDGQATSQSITVNSSGPGAFVVHAAPTEGLDSLQVTFTIENPGSTAFKQINFDLDNDGVPNLIATASQFVGGKLIVTATYPVGTWLAVIKVFDDQDRVIYSTTKSIVVLMPIVLQGNLLAIYDGMLARLRAGNIPGALTAFTGSAYDKYNAIFTQLQPSLKSIVDQLGEIREINFSDDVAEISVVRNTTDGLQRFMLYMIRAEDGIWRIDGM